MKLGLVGCGLIGKKRVTASPRLKLHVAADVLKERAEELCSRFGGHASNDWRDVIKSKVEIVVVATSHDLLAPVALEAVRAGKHVLIEKPGARSAQELVPILEMAKRNNCFVKVGFNHRFHPAVLKARELVDSGELGSLIFVRGRYGHGGRPGYEQEWRFNPEISGGGELLDQGSHLIDLARWFLGDFTNIQGMLPRYFWKASVEDNCFILLATEDGKCAHLHASWTEWKNMFSFEIYGQNGKIAIDGLGGSYGLEQIAFYKMLPEMGPPATQIWQYPFPDMSWSREMEEFLQAIQEKRSPIGDIYDAVKVLEVTDSLYKLHRSSQN